jgi:hypothetical protein
MLNAKCRTGQANASPFAFTPPRSSAYALRPESDNQRRDRQLLFSVTVILSAISTLIDLSQPLDLLRLLLVDVLKGIAGHLIRIKQFI